MIVIAVAAAAIWAIAIWWIPRRDMSAVPRPQTEVRERPAFVGREACHECHRENSDVHGRSPHAATFVLTSDSDVAQRLCGSTADGGTEFGTYHYDCDAEGLTARVPEQFGGRLFPLDFALGSGKHAVTFLTLLKDPSGETVGVEHRMSWYPRQSGLGLTPGHEGLSPGSPAEQFGRIFRGETLQRCIGCHTTDAQIDGDRLVNVQPGVQCEACHGPGSLHVEAARTARDTGSSLIQRDWSAAEEVRLCGRCHRLPEDIAPERLEAYPGSLVRFQPVGLLRSRCYQESEGELRCTTCHDPHRGLQASSVEEQSASCRDCHGRPQRSHCPVSPGTDCVRCHMPAQELIPGIAFHDHWIRVRLGSSAEARTADDPVHESDHALPAARPDGP
jgi:hypothetical protein